MYIERIKSPELKWIKLVLWHHGLGCQYSTERKSRQAKINVIFQRALYYFTIRIPLEGNEADELTLITLTMFGMQFQICVDTLLTIITQRPGLILRDQYLGAICHMIIPNLIK